MMRSLFFVMWLWTCFLSAQPPSKFLLNRIPYVPEASSTEVKPLLNTQYYLSLLEPLPTVQLPNELPMVFNPDPDLRRASALFEDAGRAMANMDHEAAVKLMAETYALQPDILTVQVRYADSLLTNQQLEEAKQMYEIILEQNPSHFQCLNNLSWLMTTEENSALYDPERALALATRARLMNPKSHHVWSTLSEAQFRLGMYAEAEQSMAFALDFANATGASIEMLVNYLLKRDRFTLAREATSLLE